MKNKNNRTNISHCLRQEDTYINTIDISFASCINLYVEKYINLTVVFESVKNILLVKLSRKTNHISYLVLLCNNVTSAKKLGIKNPRLSHH